MTEPAQLTATAALREMRAGRLHPRALTEACLARVADREPALRALTAPPAHPYPCPDGPLHGLPIGVKDVLDTADFPTQYGSPIWSWYKPRADAACVAWARAAGAFVAGKTVTTEFATRHPGPTTNPHDSRRTPGGSSSGSAAGVAAHYFPVAFGTQTAGSVIRPAAFCGVIGYKPSFGLINRAGMKIMSDSLDTIGVLARSVADCALLAGVVSGVDLGNPEAKSAPPLLGLCRTPFWERAAPETAAMMERVAGRLSQAGARVRAVTLPPLFDEFGAAHARVMNGESVRALGWEMLHARDQLSPGLREILEAALSAPPQAMTEAQGVLRDSRAAFADWMGDLDALITPAAPGVAPEGLEWTGDPAFNLIWTGLHVPCVTVPAGEGPGGMPLGVQVVARRGQDRAALAWAAWVQGGLS